MSQRQAFITRIASHLPNAPIDNERMEDVLGRVDGQASRARRVVLRKNGIRSRHYVIDPATGLPTMNNAQLTAEAVRGLGGDGFSLDEIDCLVCGTSLPDQIMPNHAVMVHGELGTPSCEVAATAGVCLAGTTAIKYAWSSVLAGVSRHAVATGSEVASMLMRAEHFEPEIAARVAALEENPEIAFEKDFLRWMLSDGAGAVLIEDQPRAGGVNLRIDWMEFFSYAHELPACMYAGAERDADGGLRGWLAQSPAERQRNSAFALKQDVRLLNEKIIEYMFNRPFEVLREKRGLSAGAVDWLLPHISSEYFREPIERALHEMDFAVSQSRWFTNLGECGNTGSASIYLMLDELVKSGRLRSGQRILCVVPESGRFSSGYFHLTVV